MLKRLITYTDFDGRDQTELFFFNMTNAEMMSLSVSREGNLEAYVRKLFDKEDVGGILDLIHDLILTSYGVKSEDGKRFIKSRQLREEFSQSAAYDVLFSELMLDGEKQKAFIDGIVPPDWPEYVKKLGLKAEAIKKEQNHSDG